MANPRVVLITGASSGVGQSTARLLSQHSFTVFGTSRNPSSADGIHGIEMLSLDVRSDDSVRACVEAVVNRSGRLDVVINNAGYELAGALEELSSEEARAQFETDFFGVVCVDFFPRECSNKGCGGASHWTRLNEKPCARRGRDRAAPSESRHICHSRGFNVRR
jgi:NAD(P)-dependent dehydrogenase (short-subunit alcohol dehydrogenase family)